MGRIYRFEAAACKSTSNGSDSRTEATKRRLRNGQRESTIRACVILVVWIKISTPYGAIESDCSQSRAVLEVPHDRLPVSCGREKVTSVARPTTICQR